MANTKSAKKAIRSSARKKGFNLAWKDRIKNTVKTLRKNLETKSAPIDILNKDLTVLQKVLDKAAKKGVLHKNRANRLKSKYAHKITAQSDKRKDNPTASEKKVAKKPARKATK